MPTHPSSPEAVAKSGPTKTFARDLRRTAAAAVLGAGLVGFGLAQYAPPAVAQFNSGAQQPSFADIVERVKPAVVSISTTNEVKVADRSGGPGGNKFEGIPGLPDDHPLNEFFKNMPGGQGGQGGPMQQRPRQAAGSGFVVSPDGYIVTNNHVVDGATKVKVSFDDQEELDAKIVGTDPRTDIALLKIEPTKPLTAVKLAEKNPRVGEWVVAVGNPFGLGGTVTAGIVSAQARNIGGPYDYMQIDAAVNHGNSGGPTFNMEGEVVGVNTAIYSPTGGNVGIAFAVPSDTVSRVIGQLQKGGKVSRGWLGVKIQNIDKDLAGSLGLKDAKGAIISEVMKDGPAADAGLKVEDAILSVNNEEIDDSRDLARTIADLPAKETVDIKVWRDKGEKVLKVKLGTYPNSAADTEEEPETPKQEDLSGNIDLKQLGLSIKAGQGKDGGVVISEVDPNSDAALKGIKEGDIVLRAANESVKTPEDVAKAVKKAQDDGLPAVMFHIKKGGDQTILVAVPLKKG
ncbi:Do family serine endopeptidase [Hyphomicrobium sulfonivorans]|uniref:Do family serine endopeptidase n=1 Tax=Hyphomicrobium sulfonivorans TaxID=121290 RepID=UPI0015714F35|nr:Do family serine endopeptidase [Hyphomicrobium sulfonivorans]MBI1650809.1 Do family serine endopeptidase [Hyphomicrobium sulfonivorans]NSL71835.1 serine protease [Hyphomicrobium sulfonivorans]